MLLCSSSCECGRHRIGLFHDCSREVGVDLPGDVALEAADDLSLAEALAGAAFDVVAGGLVMAHPHDGDDVERAVGGPVAAAAEPVSAGGASAAGGLWRDAAELGES